jgi:hypothetical protein
MEPSKILENILKKVGNENLINELITKLSQSEISTLQLALSKEIANRNTPKDILSKYQSNRFVKPSNLNPIKIKQVEIVMLQMAESLGFSPVLLSPASPLGSCSVIAKVDQNNVVSATRGLELISDSTNMLAIYLANGLKNKTIDHIKNAVHFSATCRATRAQMPKSNNALPHFGLFTLVSAGKDTGSYGFEKEALAKHLEFYISYFGNKLGHKLKVFLNIRNGYSDKIGFMDRISCQLRELYPHIEFILNKQETDNNYYKGVNFKINIEDVEIGDGGFVDWTQQLLENKKERLLISGTGVDLQFITGILS